MNNVLHDIKEIPGGCIVFVVEMAAIFACLGFVALLVLAMAP
jgi:hypothetical protein